MNSTQRKFLVERIQQKVKDKIEELKKERILFPSASNFIFKSILNGELKLQSDEVTLDALRKKALNSKAGENWLSNDRIGYDMERTIKMDLSDLIVLPEDYREEVERIKTFNNDIEEKIKLLKLQLDTIEVRVQLASDKTLQNLINEVDDMGNLSLMDTKLKMLM